MPADNDGRPRGFCFVTFEEKTQAEACALGMNGRELDGRGSCGATSRGRGRRRTGAAAAATTTTARAAAGRRTGASSWKGCPTTSRSASSTTSSTATAASTISRSAATGGAYVHLLLRPARRGLRGARDGRRASRRSGDRPVCFFSLLLLV